MSFITPYNMKPLIVLMLMGLLNSCGNEDDFFTLVGQQALKDGNHIKLLYHGGGATDVNIIWVSTESENKQKYIAIIEGSSGGYYSTIWQINDSIIKVRLTDTAIWPGAYNEFHFNLNKEVKFNDGSAFTVADTFVKAPFKTIR